MSIAQNAQTALNYGLSFVGTKESPANSNRGPKIDEWQRDVDMIAQPWCGAFAHACLKHGGVEGLSFRMRFCPFIVEDAKKGVNGLARLVAWGDKRPGDLIIYQFDTGAVDHVGLLLATVSDTVIRTVEGNTSSGLAGSQSNGGMVAQRTRARNLVAFIVRPKYPAEAVPLTPCEWPGITLKRGSRGSLVKVIQGWINTLADAGQHLNHLDVDGDFGPATEAGVKNYQRQHHLDQDGVVGPLTYRAMCASVRAHQD